jgi:hypothetical protein
MKKLIKLLAVIIDLAFIPVRILVAVQMLVCGSILHGFDLKESLKEMFGATIYLVKTGFKPTLEDIFKD